MSEPETSKDEEHPDSASEAEVEGQSEAANAPPASEDAAESPGAESPGAEDPAAESPGAEDPAPEDPAAESPGAEDPAEEDPAPESPASEESPAAVTPPEAAEPTGEVASSEAPSGASAAPAPAVAATQDEQAGGVQNPTRPAAQLGTRLIGLAWLLLFGVVGFVLVRRVYGHDFGTTNARVLSVIRLASVLLTGYPALLGLVALFTGRRPPAQLNPLGLPLDQWWYQGLNALTWRELKRVFFHPVAYIVLFVYLVINGILLAMLVQHFSSMSGGKMPNPASSYLSNNFYLWLSLILICPALTMRLLAEERRTKSLELLLTAPITETQVVLSKYGAVLCYFAFMSSFSLGYAMLIKSYAVSWDWGPILSGYLGLLLVGSLATAIGVFTSSLTRSQILAYLLAAIALVFMFLIVGMLIQPGIPPTARALLEHFSVSTHQDQFASGIISWRSLTYFVTSTMLFLFLAVRGVATQGGR